MRAMKLSTTRTRVAIRCEAATTTKAVFKVHRHVQFGQSLIITGGDSQLGSWDPTKGLALVWGDGDVWSAEATLPVGAKIEYKHVIAAHNGFNWGTGANKAVILPPSSVVELKSEWEGGPEVRVVEAVQAVEPPSAEESSVPAVTPEDAAVVTPDTTNSVEVVDTSVLSTEVEQPAAPTVSEASVTEPAIPAGPEVPEKSYTANNIVSGSPLGAVVMTQETRDAAQTFTEEDLVTAAVHKPPAALDHLTVNEIKSELKKRGLPSMGNRRQLITRLQKAGAV